MNLLKMSLSASILILAVVVVRALLLHSLPKKTFLALWGVALCRLLIPFSLPSRLSVFSVAWMLKSDFFKKGGSLTGISVIANHAAFTGNPSALPEPVYKNISAIFAIWLIGLIVCALFFLVTHLRCRKEYQTALPVDHAFVKCWKRDHPTKRNVQIRQSDTIVAPLTYGIFRPVILLPKQIDWTNEVCLRYILMHEFVHIRRLDLVTKLLLAISLCIHWFNPFVWLMYVLANRDIELSCDEAVVRTFGEITKSAYALTLIGLEETKSRHTPLVNNFSKNVIEERIVSIMKFKKASIFCTVSAVCLVIGVTTVFATSFQNNNHNMSLPKKFNNQYMNELSQGHHTGDLDPQNVLLTYISENKYKFEDFKLKRNEDMKKTYVNPTGNVEIQLTAYDVETSNGDVVRVWDARQFLYHEF